jgi:hypothetical protein
VPNASAMPGRNVLVTGVYLSDKDHQAPAIVDELARSARWHVEQRWVALGHGHVPDALARYTIAHRTTASPKFTIVNEVLADLRLADYAYIVICDDDVTLPAGFLDDFLEVVGKYDFALAQPARSHDSFIDHPFVEQLDGLTARWTRFVEIGPLFSIRHDALSHLVPFDEASPMGWGYDFVWPTTMERAGLKLGIVDSTCVVHNLRKPVAHYDHGGADQAMQRYLGTRPHVSKAEVFSIVESYV